MADDILRYEVDDRTATLTLQRPDKRNAMNAELVAALKDALDRAESDERVRVIVLTGAGSAFSAGADLASLRAMQEASAEDNLTDARQLGELFEKIYLHPKPVIACVNGPAVGGGCGLAAVCDFAIASREARMGFPEVRLGFVPAIVMVFILRKLGEADARDVLLRGALMPAEEAVEKGLITQAVAPEALKEAVGKLARELAYETSGTAVALTKRMMAHVPGMGLQEALAYAEEMNALARSTADCRAGLVAFLEREDPPWRKQR